MSTAYRLLPRNPEKKESSRSPIDHGKAVRGNGPCLPARGNLALLGAAQLLASRGAVRAGLGRVSNALDDFLSARTLYRLTRRTVEEARMCRQAATVLRNEYRYAEAVSLLEESLLCSRAADRRHDIVEDLLALADTSFMAGLFEEVRRCATEAFGLIETESPDRACRSLSVLGDLARVRGAFSKSRDLFMRAYSIALNKHLPRWERKTLQGLADVSRDAGDIEEAQLFLSRASDISRDVDDVGQWTAGLQRREAELLLLSGNPGKAQERFLQVKKLTTDRSCAAEQGLIQRGLGLCSLSLKDSTAALRCFEMSLDLFRFIDLKLEVALANFYLLRSMVDERVSIEEEDNDFARRFSRYGAEAIYLFHQLGLCAWEDRTRSLFDSVAGRKTLLPLHSARRPSRASSTEIVAVSAAMQLVLRHADNYAALSDPVLIVGETGTGKELIARRLHKMGPRKDAPFVVVNCAAIPPDLFEREFFGNKRGAYTGATASCTGFVQQAHGGTLFLDEIGDMPLVLQPKLLRLIEYQTYCRLGDPNERRADIRLIAATNAPLQRLVDEGRFRADFYFRLRLLDIEIPSLRERKEDIVPLLELFLNRIAGGAVRLQDYLPPNAIKALLQRPLKGNARELMHMARKLLLQRQLSAVSDHSPRSGLPMIETCQPKRGRTKPDALELQSVLERYDGNKAKMARHFGVARSTLYRWLLASE